MPAACCRRMRSSRPSASAARPSRWWRSRYLAGGHVRVGLEDAVYLDRGVLAPSNAAMVEKARRIVEDLGGQIADAARRRAT